MAKTGKRLKKACEGVDPAVAHPLEAAVKVELAGLSDDARA